MTITATDRVKDIIASTGAIRTEPWRTDSATVGVQGEVAIHFTGAHRRLPRTTKLRLVRSGIRCLPGASIGRRTAITPGLNPRIRGDGTAIDDTPAIPVFGPRVITGNESSVRNCTILGGTDDNSLRRTGAAIAAIIGRKG